jgi:hypothetical protein
MFSGQPHPRGGVFVEASSAFPNQEPTMPHRNFSFESEIHRIGLGLIDLSLPKTEWTHAAHFAAALWLLRYRPEWDASRRMPDFIRAYNEATGVANTDTTKPSPRLRCAPHTRRSRAIRPLRRSTESPTN